MAKGERRVQIDKRRELLVMRNAETVLAIVGERGERGLPLEDVYRMLYNPDLYLASGLPNTGRGKDPKGKRLMAPTMLLSVLSAGGSKNAIAP
jgi:hypothetical protein